MNGIKRNAFAPTRYHFIKVQLMHFVQEIFFSSFVRLSWHDAAPRSDFYIYSFIIFWANLYAQCVIDAQIVFTSTGVLSHLWWA